MLSAQFIFIQSRYDEDFTKLDDDIEAYAQTLDGFLGADRWDSRDGTKKSSTYYWRDEESLKVFSQYPLHLQAKKDYKNWYDGYQIIISQVVRSYGDGQIPHITQNLK